MFSTAGQRQGDTKTLNVWKQEMMQFLKAFAEKKQQLIYFDVRSLSVSANPNTRPELNKL